MYNNPYENNITPEQADEKNEHTEFNSQPVEKNEYPDYGAQTVYEADYREPAVAPPEIISEPDYSVDEYYKEHMASQAAQAQQYAVYGEDYFSADSASSPQPVSEPEPSYTSNYNSQNIYSSSRRRKEKKARKEPKPVSRRALVAVLMVSILSSVFLGAGGGYLASKILDSDSASKSSASANGLNVSKSDSGSASYAASGAALTTTEIVEKAADAVVEITTESVVTGSFSQQYIQSGAGSGVIITTDGYIVTNYHVIEGASNITVTLRDQTEYTDVEVVGTYEAGDLALLKISPKSALTAATFGDSDKISVGDYAVVIGNPLGQLGGSVTDGIISALDREVTIDNETMNLLQTNAEISPGNSGGGLFNGEGELIGIVNAKSSSSSAEGIGFAIPINDVQDVLSDLKQYGYVKGQIDLGMSLADINSTAQLWMYGANQTGVYVTEVTSGSNAAKAGFKYGDIITAVNGEKVSSTSELKSIIDKLSVGDKVTFTVYRSGQTGKISMKLQEYTANAQTSNNSSSAPSSDDYNWPEDVWDIFNY